jgi:hypothetical protein
MPKPTDDASRLFKGPGLVEVYVPPKPPPHPDDWKRDFPPGYPPVVRYDTVEANYWRVLEEGKMAYMHGEKVFSSEVMDWLRKIQPQVEAVLNAL